MKNLSLFFTILISAFSLSLMGQSQEKMTMSDSTMTMEMDPIVSDRPLQSERPAVTPKGNFQIELGFGVEDTEPGFIYSYPSALWKYGVTNNFEIRLITEYITIQKVPNPNINGILPVGVGIKAKLGEQKGLLPKISVIGDVTLPGIVAEDFETIYLAPDLRFAFEHRVSGFIDIGYNLGLEWDGINAEPNVNYSLYADFDLTKRLGLYVEGYGTTPQRDDVDMEIRADAGLTYLLGNNFLIDVSAGKGLTEDAVESYVAVGFSYRFKL